MDYKCCLDYIYSVPASCTGSLQNTAIINNEILCFKISATVSVFSGLARNLTGQERLYNDLLGNYDKFHRPVQDPANSLKLYFSFELIKVHEVVCN